MTTEEKISKMKALTEPVVADLLQVLRNYRKQVQEMRTMDDFASCRDSLAIVVELRDMLDAQEMVAGAQFKVPAVPSYNHLPELESKKLAAVFTGSMNAFWTVEMKLYALRNKINTVQTLERAVELTMLLRKLKNVVPEEAFDVIDGIAGGGGGGGPPPPIGAAALAVVAVVSRSEVYERTKTR